MTKQPPVKKKNPPSDRRSLVRACVFIAFAALSVLLLTFLGGCWPNDGETSSGTPDTLSKNIILNIGVSDKTGANPLNRDSVLVRVPGRGSWRPDFTWGGSSRAFGTYPVGQQAVFYIFPAGPAERRIDVPFEMKPDMRSGFASSKTYVDSLVVEGPSVPGRRLTFRR